MDLDHCLVEREGHTPVITLNRPAAGKSRYQLHATRRIGCSPEKALRVTRRSSLKVKALRAENSELEEVVAEFTLKNRVS